MRGLLYYNVIVKYETSLNRTRKKLTTVEIWIWNRIMRNKKQCINTKISNGKQDFAQYYMGNERKILRSLPETQFVFNHTYLKDE